MPSGASRNGGRTSTADRSVIDAIVTGFDARTAKDRGRTVLRSIDWRVTAGDIGDWSRAIHAQLAQTSLEPGAVVGLAAPNGPAFLAGFLAIRRARCSALLLDETTAAADRARVLSAIGAGAILQCRIEPGAGTIDARVEMLAPSTERVADPDCAVIKMTSGSTGTPRGVTITTEALLADEDALARTMALRDDERVLAALPMTHRYGFTMLALPALVRGWQLILPPDAGPLAPVTAAAACDATVFPSVPAYLQAVLKMSQPPAWPSGVRLFLTAGAILPAATAAQFREASGRNVHVFYGASECGGICFDRDGGAALRGTVGTPVEGVSISLVKSEEAGGGVLVVHSAAVAKSYLPSPDPRLQNGVFQTADLGAWRDGEIELLRRADRVINVRGFKVDPAEVEHVLAGLPGVEEVVVLASPGLGSGDATIRAVVACRPGALDAAAVTAWCRPRLAEHKVPRSVVLVDALPRTARGKLDRAALDHA